MARNVPTAAGEETKGTEPSSEEVPSSETAFAKKTITFLPETRVALAEEEECRPDHFEVVRGGDVMYGGIKVKIPVGKTLTTATHDVSILRSQGIELKQIRLPKPKAREAY